MSERDDLDELLPLNDDVELTAEPDDYRKDRWMVVGGRRGGNTRMMISGCSPDALADLRRQIDEVLASHSAPTGGDDA